MKKKIWATMAVLFLCLLGYGSVSRAAVTEFKEQPKIKSVKINKNQLRPGQTFQIAVKVSNSESVSGVFAYYITPIDGMLGNLDLKYDSRRDVWIGKIKISPGAHNGLYRFCSVQLGAEGLGKDCWENSKASREMTDMAPSRRTNLNCYNFKVKGGKNDLLEPFVKTSSLKVSTGKAKPGKRITFRIKCRDEDGIAGGSIYLEKRGEVPGLILGQKEVVLKYNKKTGMCQGSLKFEEADIKGVWNISNFYVMDGAGNGAHFSNKELAYNTYGYLISLKKYDITLK